MSPGKNPHGIFHTEINVQKMITIVFFTCLALELTLVLADCFINYADITGISGIRRLFNITNEDTFPGFFSPVQTLLVALTCWSIFFIVRTQTGRKWRIIGWGIVAFFFTFMGVDDGVKFHERIGNAFSDVFGGYGGESLLGTIADTFPSYYWQVVFVPIFGALGLFTIFFLYNELKEKNARYYVVLSMALFGIAVGMDFIEGLSEDSPLNIYAWFTNQFDFSGVTKSFFNKDPFEAVIHFSKSIEEFLEMFATTILWVVFLRHLTHVAEEIKIRFFVPKSA